MIRPFYCSRLFWLGIPGLLFLLLAWGRSNFSSTHAWFPRAIYSWQAESVSGGVQWWHKESRIIPGPEWDPPPRYSVWTNEVSPDHRRWFKWPIWRKESYSELGQTHYRFHSLPYWLLTIGYTSFWLGGVVTWQRRKSRLFKLHSATPP